MNDAHEVFMITDRGDRGYVWSGPYSRVEAFEFLESNPPKYPTALLSIADAFEAGTLVGENSNELHTKRED